MKIGKMLIIVVVVMVMAGCAPMFAHYHLDPLDKYVDQNLINSPVEKPGRTFWVSEYQYDERTWKFKEWSGLININPRTQANVTLFVKEAIKKQFPNALFVADTNKADTTIVIKRLRFYSGWSWVNVELKSEVNTKEVVFEERLYSKDVNYSEEEASNVIKKLASLLVLKIREMGIKQTSSN
jgi:hypothetical protein